MQIRLLHRVTQMLLYYSRQTKQWIQTTLCVIKSTLILFAKSRIFESMSFIVFWNSSSLFPVGSIRSKEGEKILRYIKDDMYVITLEIAGKMLTSEELAERIEKLGIQGKSSIAFVIGGSIGLGKEVLKRSDYALSFSKMTFPHQLMRVILLEQVYRSYRIMNGEPYHK